VRFAGGADDEDNFATPSAIITKLLGLFAQSHMRFDLERGPVQVTLRR
jgi:alkaline phosphatase